MITTACLLIVEYDDDNREIQSYTAYGTMPHFADAAPLVDAFSANTQNSITNYSNRLPHQKKG